MPYDWAVQQLRLSLFASEPITLSESLWKTITGQDEAESRTAVPGGKQYSGKFLGGVLVMSYAASRADFVLNLDEAAIDLTQEEVFSPTIGKWTDLATSFAKTAETILQNFPSPTVRLAFSGNLLLQTESREDSYKKLDDLLVSVEVDTKSRDLIFRINWPQESEAVDGLELNRITTWSAINFKRTLRVTGSEGAVAPSIETPFVRLEFDHNTDQARKETFEKAQTVPIFQELLKLARENAETGECI
jgi:hypothetical protein